MASKDLPVYGIDAELEAKKESNYDHSMEARAQDWMEKVLGDSYSVQGNFHDSLKSGVMLCKLMNAVNNNVIHKIGTGNAPFVQMENIGSYLKACQQLGLAQHDLFQTVDLYEAKNMGQVVNNILALKRKVETNK